VIIPADKMNAERLSSQISLINQFVKLSGTTVSVNAEKPGFAGSAVVRGTQVFLLFEGLIDLSVEMDRLSKEITKASNLVQSTSSRLNNESFTSRAPADIIAKEREKLQGMILNLEKLQKQFEEVKKIVEKN
jgi:valyl-tRNA synthetase